MDTLRKVLAFILLFGIAAGLLVGCGFDSGKELKELEDFERAKIGVMTGSSQSVIAKKRFPEAQLVYFSRPADMVLAVEQGKIDCYMLGSPFLAVTLWENARVKRIEEAVAQGDIAFAFSKNGSGGNLRAQLNEFLRQAKADRTLEYLDEKWLGDTEPTEHPDYKSLTGENGTIRLAAVAENKPLIYQYRDQCTGYEMELLTIFARQYGYRFEIEIVPFDSVIMGMATGKYDMTSAGLQITPERAESVSFSDPYTQFDVVLVVRDDGAPRSQFSTLADLENATIGIATGTSWDIVAQERFPNAERMYFTSSADLLLALEHGRIDTFLTDRTVFVGMNWENAAITSIDEPIMTVSNALLFAKEGYDENLLRQVNEFVAASKADGTLERLENKWFVDEEPTEHPDYQSLTGENGTIKVAAVDYMKPAMYKKGSQYTGYEVDFLTLFAEKYGYKLHIEGMIFEALIPSVISGRFDIGACGITITPERSESVTFADSHFETYGVAVIRDESADMRSASRAIQSIDDLKGGNIAVLTGSIWDGVAREKLPDVDIRYFSSMADMLLSVEQGKVNACLGDRTFYVNARWEDVPVSILDDTVGHISCGFMLAKENYDAVLLEQLNGFIAQSRENGFIDSLADKWLSEAEPSVHPDYQSLTGENGTLKIAVGDTLKPMTYLKNGAYTGLDVDFLTEFARSCGYRLEFVGMAFDALIPTVASGKCDIAACGTAITTERAESVMFSDCYLEVDGVLIVSEKTETAAQNSFFDDLSESFEKTFIREDRWKLIAEGIGVTILISLSSAVAGTILGLGLYMLSRCDAKAVRLIAKGVAKVYSRIVAGTPVVVILMILYYVIFGKIRDMSGILVAIIGFMLTFGAFVYEHMTVSVNSVDKGQTDAAYALGYPKNKAFFRVVFPQAMKIFMPSYCSHAVELIKATAVVGYIAVNDLTKMGDIIRSNTYEAFFPLIATALIYFALTWMLSLLLGMVRKRFEPGRRSREDILKGVKTV